MVEMIQTHHVINAVLLYKERGVIAAIQYLKDKGISFEVALAILEQVDITLDLLRQDKPIP